MVLIIIVQKALTSGKPNDVRAQRFHDIYNRGLNKSNGSDDDDYVDISEDDDDDTLAQNSDIHNGLVRYLFVWDHTSLYIRENV